MFAVDQSVRLSDGRARQHRIHRRTAKPLARSQFTGFLETTTGFARRDSPPDGQHVAPGLGAHRPRRGLDLQARQQTVTLNGQLTRERFEFVEDSNQLDIGERIGGQCRHGVVRGTQFGYRRLQLTRTHDSNIRSILKNSLTHFRRIH